MKTAELKEKLKYIDIEYIYSCKSEERQQYIERFEKVIDGFTETFGEAEDLRIFSAPGRTEIGGNHTDHNKEQLLPVD